MYKFEALFTQQLQGGKACILLRNYTSQHGLLYKGLPRTGNEVDDSWTRIKKNSSSFSLRCNRDSCSENVYKIKCCSPFLSTFFKIKCQTNRILKRRILSFSSFFFLLSFCNVERNPAVHKLRETRIKMKRTYRKKQKGWKNRFFRPFTDGTRSSAIFSTNDVLRNNNGKIQQRNPS